MLQAGHGFLGVSQRKAWLKVRVWPLAEVSYLVIAQTAKPKRSNDYDRFACIIQLVAVYGGKG